MLKDIFKKFKKKLTREFCLKLAKYLLYLFLAGVFLIFLVFFYFTWNLPKPENFTETPFIQSTKIYDRTGEVLLFDIYGEEKREIISFDKISDNLKNAVLVAEDARFYQHSGIDFEGILRAILVDLKLQAKSQGGSTITQQLIRAVYLTKEKSISRKIKEIVLSIELERKYSKDQIFSWYLNQIPFGSNSYGAESASQTYFKKHASELSLAEAAVLASLIPAPSRYSPYGPNKSELLQKKDNILQKMQKTDYITEQQFLEAKEEKIVFAEDTTPIKAPHFVMYIKKYLDYKYGEDYLREKGLRVYTTLDYELQEYSEEVVKEFDKTLKAKRANNAALVVLNPKNGEILSLIGSKDYFAEPYPETGSVLFDPKYDVATMALRQPGSAFKPIVYATAFKKGYTPNTILWDVKTEFNPSCNPSGDAIIDRYGQACYNPQNYDGSYKGPVSIKTALSCSLNIPAVKTLYLAGIPETIQTARDFGMTTLNDINNYGLALVLGGGAVNLLELTSAYGVFATEGNYVSPAGILKITDVNGNILEEKKNQPNRVLDIQIARQINNILSDNNTRALVFGYNSPLQIPGYEIAAKTGTTQNSIDGWTMGYTPYAVVGVWTGNNDNSPTNDIGVGTAAPIWNKIMRKIVESNPVENFTPPNKITETGRNPALLGQIPKDDIHTLLYYIDKNNPLGPTPQNPSTDPQYLLWQIAINNYLINKGLMLQPNDNNNPSN